ncbi:helix-turn-helix domain-containing protein [Actinoplanes italicus]|uniref:Helix-turn-helix protein n=1 Tax=Actinoplanes italicus TaxID=113567 RepID=A0A2T0KIY5_9ACTN|nr:helix-turn-helix domain-containing protein [Actinoplanes italicus]PRX23485.1 helix-turn-helix protein [Actinoplanes italicus]
MPARGPYNPITDEDRGRIISLHAEGLSRNKIAKLAKRSQATVSKVCAEAGLSFDRHLVAEAVAARVVDAAHRRAKLQDEALAGAQRLMEQMFTESKIYNFGGKENDYNERSVPEPPFRDKQSIAIAVKALADTALKLAEYDKDTGDEGEKSMLTDLRDRLIQAFGAPRNQ